MSEKKKIDFGLPDIGGRSVAATLVGRRQTDAPREEEDATPAEASTAEAASLSPTAPPETGANSPSLESTEPTQPMKPIEAPVTTATSAIPIQLSPELNRGGRPRKGSKRMHVAFAPAIAEYLELAWRTHRRPDGSLAAGPSSLLEDLLIEHRQRNRA